MYPCTNATTLSPLCDVHVTKSQRQTIRYFNDTSHDCGLSCQTLCLHGLCGDQLESAIQIDCMSECNPSSVVKERKFNSLTK